MTKRDKSYALICNTVLTNQKNNFLSNKNPVYKAVENLFLDLDLDTKNYHKQWNPLGVIIKRGDKVVIKPNFVSARDREHSLTDNELLSTSTNPAVLKPIVDYAWKALKGEGKIYIVDSPIEGSDFKETLDRLGISKMINSLQKKGVNIEVLDLRDFTLLRKMPVDNFIMGNYSFNLGFLAKKSLNGDPRGYKLVDLKKGSFFSVKNWSHKKLRFPRIHSNIPVDYHSFSKNIYSISKTVLESDVFINVPKLKTHKKTGVTLSLKTLIGLTNRKYWLPHYREGLPPGGDESPSKLPFLKLLQKKLSRFSLPLGYSLIVNIVNLKSKEKYISEGDWQGNDTLWRVIADMNRILFFADKRGNMTKVPQRKNLIIVDGIWGGEKDGPLRPTPKRSGILLGGFNPVIIDSVAANLMGFDHRLLKQIVETSEIFGISKRNLENIVNDFNKKYKMNLKFKPPYGWEGIVRE